MPDVTPWQTAAAPRPPPQLPRPPPLLPRPPPLLPRPPPRCEALHLSCRGPPPHCLGLTSAAEASTSAGEGLSQVSLRSEEEPGPSTVRGARALHTPNTTKGQGEDAAFWPSEKAGSEGRGP
ncbi:hypothetical protein KUCAC02_033877 [Chaenocephalus aceratus]|nr:hypothetical protein KUCAC02_033877 [Chaenocephalus aceratus]